MLFLYIKLITYAFVQTMAFSLVSRARNRDHMGYHAIASVMSNGIFYLTFRELVLADMSWQLFIPYLIGTVTGSLYGARVAMKIEQLLGAKT